MDRKDNTSRYEQKMQYFLVFFFLAAHLALTATKMGVIMTLSTMRAPMTPPVIFFHFSIVSEKQELIKVSLGRWVHGSDW